MGSPASGESLLPNPDQIGCSDRIREGAIALFTYLIETHLEPAAPYAWRAWSYYRQQEYELTILDSTESIDLQPSEFAYWVRGSAYEGLGDLQSALTDFCRSIDIEPTDSNNYAARGRIYEQMGELQLAYDDYTNAINLSPANANNYAYRACIWEKVNFYEQAVADYTTAILKLPVKPICPLWSQQTSPVLHLVLLPHNLFSKDRLFVPLNKL